MIIIQGTFNILCKKLLFQGLGIGDIQGNFLDDKSYKMLIQTIFESQRPKATARMPTTILLKV